MTVWTIGHSTHPLDRFLRLLEAHRIRAVADVRRFPASRRHPHFAGPALEASLAARGIGYAWLPGLGGRRRPRPDSPNTGWRNESFRGYADHMDTPEFGAAAGELLRLAARDRTAILCAEEAWQRCHRGLIADWLGVRGHEVAHITGAGRLAPHPFTAPAVVRDGVLSYGAPALFDTGSPVE